MTNRVVFSVDLEPNKDGTLYQVRDAMEWFDRTVPRGTVFATYRIASEMPDLLADLSESHEIGVHVHPREFGYNHDRLAELDSNTQKEVIETTRRAISDVIGSEPSAFRAGRHSASCDTFSILQELGFTIDASVNVLYNEHLPERIVNRQSPFMLCTDLFEVPTSYSRPPILSQIGLRTLPNRTLTATANTLRTDKRLVTGVQALNWLRDFKCTFSMYMHPYDATKYHSKLENNGSEFRTRIEDLFEPINPSKFVKISDIDE